MPQFLFFCHPQKVRKRRGECHWTHLLCANKRCDEMVREIFIHAEDRSRERGHSSTMWTKFYPILTTYSPLGHSLTRTLYCFHLMLYFFRSSTVMFEFLFKLLSKLLSKFWSKIMFKINVQTFCQISLRISLQIPTQILVQIPVQIPV